MMPSAAVSRPAACGAPPLIDIRNSTRGFLGAPDEAVGQRLHVGAALRDQRLASAVLPVALPTASIFLITLS